MKLFLHFVLIILFPYSILEAQETRTLRIEVANITAFKQLDEQIKMKRKDLEALVGTISDTVIPVIKDPQLTCIPSQTDDLDGNQKWDELVFVYHMLPRQRTIFTISFLGKTNAPVFTSRSNMDIYRFGQEIGAGSLAIMDNDTMIRLTDNVDSTIFTFIGKGPVRSIFRLDHYGWDIRGKKYTVHQLVSSWAGRLGYENKVWIEGDSTNKKLIVGPVHNTTRNTLILKKYVPGLTAFIIHNRQSLNRGKYFGLALLFPSDKYLGFPGTEIQDICCALLQMPAYKPLTFYVYAGSELEDKGFRNADYFVKMITHEAAMINMPARVRILEN